MGAIYVGKKLGAGGFEMEVVLKQLLEEFTQQEEFIDLFLREAKLSATLDHANIIHTIDLVTANGEYFIVMEYLPGGDLRTLLKRAKRRGKRFSPAAAIYICREVLSALAYAHVKRDFNGSPLQLIHRDVSPSNILVSYAGEVKLTDFGIAKAATHTSLFYKVKGKIGYMSPEQAKSEPLDHRSDLYSLAVCLFEVLTGERLFVHAGLTTSADEIYSQPVPHVSRKVPGLTTDLDAIMSKALALSPDVRYQTAGEFQEALTRCAHRNGLLISAPEVALELHDVCGPPDQWRGDEDDDDAGVQPRAGTEVYDGEDDDDEELAGAGAPSVHGIPIASSGARSGSAAMASSSSGSLPGVANRPGRHPRAKSEFAKMGVVELTSIINMIDLENQHREALGARPLVDNDLRSRLGDPEPAAALAESPARGVPAASDVRGVPAAEWQRGAGANDPRAATPRPVIARPQPVQVPHFPAPAAQAPGTMPGGARRPTAARPRKKSAFRTWLVIVAILLAAAAAGVFVAMSGPDVAVKTRKAP